VTLEATTNAWHLNDALVPLGRLGDGGKSVQVALIAKARVNRQSRS
jgi:hypothetical protein